MTTRVLDLWDEYLDGEILPEFNPYLDYDNDYGDYPEEAEEVPTIEEYEYEELLEEDQEDWLDEEEWLDGEEWLEDWERE